MSSRARNDNRAQRLRDAIWQAHGALHNDDQAACHTILHRALGLADDAGVTPAKPAPARYAEFDERFRALCSELGVPAAYLAEESQRALAGGTQELCALIRDALHALERQRAATRPT